MGCDGGLVFSHCYIRDFRTSFWIILRLIRVCRSRFFFKVASEREAKHFRISYQRNVAPAWLLFCTHVLHIFVIVKYNTTAWERLLFFSIWYIGTFLSRILRLESMYDGHVLSRQPREKANTSVNIESENCEARLTLSHFFSVEIFTHILVLCIVYCTIQILSNIGIIILIWHILNWKREAKHLEISNQKTRPSTP